MSDRRLSMDAAGVIAHYVMDTSTSVSTGSAQRISASSDRPLTAETGSNTTFYLYGLGAIGEKATEWNYSLPDGTNPSITLRAGTPRQLTDMQGEVTLLARYTPCPLAGVLREGDTLETYGTGNFTFGYFGGVLDAATGLLYVGNGQYGVYPERSRRDPATGRFLTREINSNSPNPYVPWNPIGAILGPLALVSLFYTRRKKGSKTGTFLVLLIVLGGVGLTLAGCQFTTNGYDVTVTQSPAQPNTYNITATPTTVPSSTPSPTDTPLPTITATCTVTPTPATLDDEMAQYGVYFAGATDNLMREWTDFRKGAVKSAVREVANRFQGIIGGTPQEALKRVYGYINFEWCENCSSGFGIAADDHTIKFDGMYMLEHRAIRLVVHELGHLFDRKICATRQSDGICSVPEQDVFHDSARTDLSDVWNTMYCGRDTNGEPYLCLGRPSHSGPEPGMYWGFAGDFEEWQFGMTHDPGEVWADMFLGWVYNTWGSDPYGFAVAKQNYMNSQMASYLQMVR